MLNTPLGPERTSLDGAQPRWFGDDGCIRPAVPADWLSAELDVDLMYANLLDRFGPEEDVGPASIADELADMLSGRQAYAQRDLGVLSWGLPSMLNLVARSPGDRQYIAECIADTIHRFQPRLEGVKVTPVESASDFAFTIEATLADDSSTINLRILSPYVGGGLGANVEVVSIRDDF